MNKHRAGGVIVLGLALVAIAACTATGPPAQEAEHSGPIEPVEAFEEVGEPREIYTGTGDNDPDRLSDDIRRLQDARRKFNQEHDRRAAESKRHQAQCRESPDTDKVPIEDGSEEPGVYCQPRP